MAPSSASASSSTTLRPRNRRHTNGDDNNAFAAPSVSSDHLDAPSTSAHSSRPASPIKNVRSARSVQAERGNQRSRSTSRFLGVSNLMGPQSTPASFATGLWESSWSSIQGMASSLISGDSSGISSPARSSSRKRRPFDSSQGRTTSAPPAQWGPLGSNNKQSDSGTLEARRAQVQAKKRENLLVANGHVAPDSLGRYKRRGSDERDRISEDPIDHDNRDALVYIHKVKPGDTLAGIIIKYNCQPNVFRKANRLWPNDSIQVRNTVVLPLDACGVKGIKILQPDGHPSITEAGCMDEILPTPTATHAPWADFDQTLEDKETPFSSIPTSPSISISLSNSEEPPWKHDSWVMIEGFPDAVEIARLSRRTLGYFPRGRRKSLTFSDVGTPPTSFDLPRASYQSSTSRPITKSRSSSGSFPATQLLGPGGVGTMGTNVRSPGPAQDGLNKLFSAHLPDVAPRASLESINSHLSHGNGMENFGGAVEGWVKKIATKASTSLQPSTPGGRSGAGDLIELSEDVFERGDSLGDRGRSQYNSQTARSISGWRSEQERTLQERMMPTGRAMGELRKD